MKISIENEEIATGREVRFYKKNNSHVFHLTEYMYNKNRLKFFVVYLFYNYFLFLRIYRSVAEGKSRANSRKMVLIPESQLILTKNSIENSVGWFAGALLSDICPPKLSHRYLIGWGHTHRHIRTFHNFKVWIHRVGKVQKRNTKK